MLVLRVLFCMISFSICSSIADTCSPAPLVELISNKFEIYDSILESVSRSIYQQSRKIQNELYDIKAENSTAFECVGLYGDLFPINQLNSSFQSRLDEFTNRKEIVTDFLKVNSNVSF